tara:strand:+ start:52988 stop:54367 length:1380 start_codon:yes stop_codon:yes gene_type:complete
MGRNCLSKKNEKKGKRNKMNIHKKIILLLCACSCIQVMGQGKNSRIVTLSFLESIDKASKENISIEAMKIEESAALSEFKESKSYVLPKWSATAAYQRFSKITLYDGFLGESELVSKPPNANAGNFGMEAFFNLYKGGKQKNAVKIASYKNDLSAIQTEELTANVHLQVAQYYFDLVRLQYLKNITMEQIHRAEKRLENINSLYQNGKVTRSDVLRAELMLSKVSLDHNEAINDYTISNKKLNVLLKLEESALIIPSDTTNFKRIDAMDLKEILFGPTVPYALQINEKFIAISEVQKKIIKADNLPSLGLIGGYNFNYPNTLIMPPLDQTYGIGFVGLKMSFDISSLYQNHHKINASNYRLEKIKLQTKYVEENIEQEKHSLYIKYMEALNRIEVTEKSIEQAKSNYNIVNTKYFNQLALLTDLLDADNLYQQSKFDYIRARINTIILYNKILYLTAQL